MTTTIQISDEVWEELNKKKKKGQTFEDVLRSVLKLNKEARKNEVLQLFKKIVQ